MLEAAKAAGISTFGFESILAGCANGFDAEFARNSGMSSGLADYLALCDDNRREFATCFSTVALRELVLSYGFQKMLDRLPAESRLLRFRGFLQAHVTLDTEGHGPLMASDLERFGDPGRPISVMVEFCRLRKVVYDECLLKAPLFV